jgi:hypothetical protein
LKFSFCSGKHDLFFLCFPERFLYFSAKNIVFGCFPERM